MRHTASCAPIFGRTLPGPGPRPPARIAAGPHRDTPSHQKTQGGTPSWLLYGLEVNKADRTKFHASLVGNENVITVQHTRAAIDLTRDGLRNCHLSRVRDRDFHLLDPKL